MRSEPHATSKCILEACGLERTLLVTCPDSRICKFRARNTSSVRSGLHATSNSILVACGTESTLLVNRPDSKIYKSTDSEILVACLPKRTLLITWLEAPHADA